MSVTVFKFFPDDILLKRTVCDFFHFHLRIVSFCEIEISGSFIISEQNKIFLSRMHYHPGTVYYFNDLHCKHSQQDVITISVVIQSEIML